MVFLKGTEQNLTDLFDGFGSLNTWNFVQTLHVLKVHLEKFTI